MRLKPSDLNRLKWCSKEELPTGSALIYRDEDIKASFQYLEEDNYIEVVKGFGNLSCFSNNELKDELKLHNLRVLTKR